MFYKLILQAFIVLGVSVTYIFEYFTRVTKLVLIFCRRGEENGLLGRKVRGGSEWIDNNTDDVKKNAISAIFALFEAPSHFLTIKYTYTCKCISLLFRDP